MKTLLLILLLAGNADAFLGKSVVACSKSGAIKSATAFPSANTVTLEQGSTVDNPANAYADDGSYVSQGTGASGFGDGLAGAVRYTGFGFSIPTGATILGVVAKWEKYSADPSNTYDASVKLVKAGSAAGDSKSQFVTWPASPTILEYGGQFDLWGNTLTPADVNASNFGLYINWVFTNLGTTPVVFYDYVKLTVYYRE